MNKLLATLQSHRANVTCLKGFRILPSEMNINGTQNKLAKFLQSSTDKEKEMLHLVSGGGLGDN